LLILQQRIKFLLIRLKYLLNSRLPRGRSLWQVGKKQGAAAQVKDESGRERDKAGKRSKTIERLILTQKLSS